MNTKYLIAQFVLLFVTLTSACFITNCPKSGKRSIDAGIPLRECMACGPEGRGRCFGSDICCIPELGCSMKTPDSFMCKLEALNPRPCKSPGPSCGIDGQGTCASSGLCCTTETCTVDKSCTRKESAIYPFYEQFLPHYSSEYISDQH